MLKGQLQTSSLLHSTTKWKIISKYEEKKLGDNRIKLYAAIREQCPGPRYADEEGQPYHMNANYF